ncbi:hypothetical protein OPV22_011774 [Ensete ventricosum]|uniref:Uncharacterized protein n=1 Tax=Ensete ventricosum TaxID=4639 RepID=A0AAV8RJV1_ENSVE|nr:hypothetical protein OPV22_011774 [Ensete ventricosum]
MGDISSNRPSTAEISAIEGLSKDPQVVDSGSKGWTDEKHTLFLNSIEASFVNELYNEQYHSKAVQGWLSRTKEHKGSTEPSMKYGQFKVLRKGCWRNLRFEMDNNHAEIENGSFPLCTNPWIQHFRSPYILKEKHLKSSDRDDDIEFIRPSTQIASERLDGEATSSKHICHQDSIDSSTEVSDQNFIADELIVGQRSSRICRKRRRGTALVHEPINDQLIGSSIQKAPVTTISDVNHACPRPANLRSDATTCEVIASIVPTETEASLCKDQEVNSRNFEDANRSSRQSSGNKI